MSGLMAWRSADASTESAGPTSARASEAPAARAIRTAAAAILRMAGTLRHGSRPCIPEEPPDPSGEQAQDELDELVLELAQAIGAPRADLLGDELGDRDDEDAR